MLPSHPFRGNFKLGISLFGFFFSPSHPCNHIRGNFKPGISLFRYFYSLSHHSKSIRDNFKPGIFFVTKGCKTSKKVMKLYDVIRCLMKKTAGRIFNEYYSFSMGSFIMAEMK